MKRTFGNSYLQVEVDKVLILQNKKVKEGYIYIFLNGLLGLVTDHNGNKKINA